jgi:hypothetical protein
MVIEKILKQLTPERIKKEVEIIQAIELPPEIKNWVKEYEKVGDRPEFLWKWMYLGVQIVTAPFVPKKYERSLWEVKTLIIMFITLIDDIADKTQNKKLLNELLKIPFEKELIDKDILDYNEKKYVEIAINLWKYIEAKLSDYTNYSRFKIIFEYDFCQVLNEMRYSQLVNDNNYLINKIEYWEILPYNMQGIVSYTVDLMCWKNINFEQIGKIRETAWLLQRMAKIANWVSTWERELEESDLTNGVICEVIDKNLINYKDLKRYPEISKKINKIFIEKILLDEWEKAYLTISGFKKELKNIDIKRILSDAEKFLFIHLISKQKI